MPQPHDATDLRRADERGLLAALRAGQPLALAEAYHRTVPAAHAVARRLLGSSGGVEDLLLDVYARLWEEAPDDRPLEGWVRRTTWALGVERLREAHAAPSSPSTAGLLPDLPAPDVRFLDAAERAIAELDDDERRALLLAHDKGVPTDAQDPGAGSALTRALLALAGPETAASDRQAMAEDPCADVSTMGDWCLGVLGDAEESTVITAIEQRGGCAASSRAVRRGRRRIEGLPATPDMGQRILVSVLTAGGAAAVAPARSSPEPSPTMAPFTDAFVDAALAEAASGELPAMDGPAADPDVSPSAGAGDAARSGPDEVPETSPFGPTAGTTPQVDDAVDEDDPFGDLGVDEIADADPAVSDTADLPQSTEDDTAATDSWKPGPGETTAELRLSDILADDDDDPFAGLDDDDAAFGDPDPEPVGRDPYSALRGLGEDGEPLQPQGPISPAFSGAATEARPVALPGEDEELVGGYVEGQEDYDSPDADRRSPMASVLAWILPILGGSVVGIIVAIQVFGLPG